MNIVKLTIITAVAFMAMLYAGKTASSQITIFNEPSTTSFQCGASVGGNVVCFGGDGGIWRTINAGESLTRVFTRVGPVGDMMFSGQTGYATAPGGSRNTTVLKTTDGGMTWSPCYTSPDSVWFKHLFVKSPTEIFANFSGASSGRDAQLYRSTDGGLTWSVVWQLHIYAFEGVTGDNEGNIFVTGSSVWSTHDLVGWSTHTNPTVFPFSNAVYSEGRLYVGGDAYVNGNVYPTVAYSTNKGIDWVNFNFPDVGYCQNISFAPNGIGYANGYNWFAMTLNHGNSWERIYVTSSSGISNVCATSNYGYALGSSGGEGMIIRFNSTAAGTGSQGSLVPDNFGLKQNYPNPFNPTTKINFTLPKNSQVTLKVFNVVGNEVATLISGMKNAGEYSVDFNGAQLSSGMYFYVLQAGDFKETKKMMLIK